MVTTLPHGAFLFFETIDASTYFCQNIALTMTKADIRKQQLLWRKGLSDHLYYGLSQQLADQFFLNFHTILLKIKYLHLFLPIEANREPNTNFIWKTAQQRFRNLQLVVPVANFETKTMQHILADNSTEFAPNQYGIPEPQAGKVIAPELIDIVLVPLLAFDSQGHRLGYGGGFYDRFLAQTKPDCLKIGLSLAQEPSPNLPTSPTDVALNYCISPSKLWHFDPK
jgi:5-formyltetrahydrofolate cyclo-ligase